MAIKHTTVAEKKQAAMSNKVSTFKFKEGAHIKLDPEVVGNHLTKLINKSGGELSPQTVMDDARDDNSPIHNHFEWDDQAAAEAHRLSQARYLIRNVEVVYISGPYRDKGPIQAFVRTQDTGSSYVTIDRLMSDDKLREQYLSSLRQEAIYCRNRLSKFEEFEAVCKSIDEVIAKVA